MIARKPDLKKGIKAMRKLQDKRVSNDVGCVECKRLGKGFVPAMQNSTICPECLDNIGRDMENLL